MDWFEIITASTLMFVLLVGLLFLTVVVVARRYHRCAPDEVLVVAGRTGKTREVGPDGRPVARPRVAKCVHGGATFILPLIQEVHRLSLKPITIDIDLRGALTKENIRINAPSSFTVAIGLDTAVMTNAAVRLLGLDAEEIERYAKDIIFGQYRATVASMFLEDINRDREKFQQAVTDSVEFELKKIGLCVLNVNIRDLTDESHYLETLGRKATAEAVQKANVDVAEQERVGKSGVAKAEQVREVAIAEARKDQRVKVADAEATAVEGENIAEQRKAKASSQLRIAKANAESEAFAAERTQRAEAERKGLEAELSVQTALLDKEKKAREAAVLPEADAEAERIRRIAKAQADAQKMLLEARAAGLRAVLDAAAGDPNAAVAVLLAEHMPHLAELRVEAVKALRIDKAVVFGQDGDAAAGWMRGLVAGLPSAHELLAACDVVPPKILGEKAAKDAAK